mmetsp:Transcript_3880/g.6635  ORF Transcript_3880/g.6635 Transcript_3880/m.6635 type:complete len:361 (-) Transcript_3880:146-1228(-)
MIVSIQKLAPLFFFFATIASAIASAPIAPHQLVQVDPGSEVVITLAGYDLDGDSLTVSIESLPSSGRLYQLSQVYSTHGYDPKQGTAITSSGTQVTGSKNRIVYSRPSVDSVKYEKWDTFTYTVFDGTTTSAEGTVTLVPKTGVMVGSDFLLGNEDWKITGNKASNSLATYEASSRGLVNHYIHGTDDLINVGRIGGDGTDADRWYFSAPSEFLGNQGIAYGGQLKFTLSAHAGDFTASNLNKDAYLVELYCAQCAVNSGVTISYPLSSSGFTGSDKAFSLTLHEKAGWMKDPENTLKSWTVPSKCDFIEVLSGLTHVKILGDFTKWYESVSLDNVAIVNSKQQLPICAQGSPDASVCSC